MTCLARICLHLQLHLWQTNALPTMHQAKARDRIDSGGAGGMLQGDWGQVESVEQDAAV